MRDSYMRKQITYLAIGLIFAAILIIISGGRELKAVLFGAFIVVFMYLLAQLSYMPGLNIKKPHVKYGEKNIQPRKEVKKRHSRKSI